MITVQSLLGLENPFEDEKSLMVYIYANLSDMIYPTEIEWEMIKIPPLEKNPSMKAYSLS